MQSPGSTYSYFCKHGVWQSSQLSGAAEHDQPNEMSPEEVTGWKRKRAGTGASEHYEEQKLGRRQQKCDAALQHLNSEIQLFKLNEIDANYKDNHIRIPDLSADIRIVFPTEEYIGAYASHGLRKTVFVIRSSSHKQASFDGAVLKISRGYDIEPSMLRVMPKIAPTLYYEGIGKDGDVEYHCWVTERCIPLHRLPTLSTCSKSACVLAACRCIATAALCRIHLSDCHYYNLGVRIASGATEHEVVIIDPGSRGVADSVPTKSDVSKSMRKLWQWSKEEIHAEPTSTQQLWTQHEHKLEEITRRLDSTWRSWPYLTTIKLPTSYIDEEITAKCSRALREFTRSPHGKVVELIGRSSVEWRGGAWNHRLSECCVDAIEEAHITFEADEERVLQELYERITKHWKKTRTKEEIKAIVAFWWTLQTYRRQYLERQRRYDTAEEELSETDIAKVKRDWEDAELWPDLTERQRNTKHIPSIYNAILHNRSGWATDFGSGYAHVFS